MGALLCSGNYISLMSKQQTRKNEIAFSFFIRINIHFTSGILRSLNFRDLRNARKKTKEFLKVALLTGPPSEILFQLLWQSNPFNEGLD